MDVLRRLRVSGCDVDVMVVTVLRDPSMLQAAMALGVVHYLLKPFTAATLQRKLEHYRAFRARRLAGAGHPIAQHEIDEVFTRCERWPPTPSLEVSDMSRCRRSPASCAARR